MIRLGLIFFKAVFFTKKTIKTVKDENIDDKEEYLNIRLTTNHVKIKRKLNSNDMANSIPRYVATPLPPLNFNQIGKTCPKKVMMQDNWVNSGKYFKEIITGTYPFNTSNKSVIAASNLFPVLRTFVAPILPEPIFLISKFPKVFDKIKPKGIDPKT